MHSAERVNVHCLALLPVGLALPPQSPGARWSLTPPFHPYRLRGGLFSVALSRGSPRVGVTHHRILWSPDVPRGLSPTRPPSRLIRGSSVAPRLVLVLILLPPSEGKTGPTTGPTLDLSALSYPALTDARVQILNELIAVSKRSDALKILGAGKSLIHEVEAQCALSHAPCAPAREIYSGVLYEAAQLREGDDALIFSGLFGVTHADDLLPTYRLSMGVTLPDAGNLKSFWRHKLLALPNDADETYVDMRSGIYQVWNPQGTWWDVRIINAEGKVISHMAKHYRGLLTRALLDAGVSPDIADVARTLGDVTVDAVKNRRHLTIRLPKDAP